jgi:tripartite-type tricarboxylate transporter receptor subunit TctC
LIRQKITESTGQTVIVDNRPGAGGQIGADAVKKSRPDGYTLYLSNIGSHGINESLYTKLNYDPLADFESVTLLFSSANLVLVPPSSPAKNMADLIALAKSMGGKMTYASQSIGSGGHISGEIVKSKNNVQLVHVPYKGSAPALIDLVSGRVDFLFDPIITALPFAKEGKVRALGITSEKRSPRPRSRRCASRASPATTSTPVWHPHAPAGTPRPVIDRLNAEFPQGDGEPGHRQAHDRAGHRHHHRNAGGIYGLHQGRDGALARGRQASGAKVD